MMCTMPWRLSAMPKYLTPKSSTFRSSACTWVRDATSARKASTASLPAWKASRFDVEVLDVPLERLHLGPRRDVGQEGLDGLAARVEGVAVRRRHVVVHRRERAVGPPHGPAGEAQALEGLRRRHLVDQVAVDVDERRAGLVLGHDEVVVPDLVEERPRRAPRRREAIGTHHHCYGDD